MEWKRRNGLFWWAGKHFRISRPPAPILGLQIAGSSLRLVSGNEVSELSKLHPDPKTSGGSQRERERGRLWKTAEIIARVSNSQLKNDSFSSFILVLFHWKQSIPPAEPWDLERHIAGLLTRIRANRFLLRARGWLSALYIRRLRRFLVRFGLLRSSSFSHGAKQRNKRVDMSEAT